MLKISVAASRPCSMAVIDSGVAFSEMVVESLMSEKRMAASLASDTVSSLPRPRLRERR